MSKIIGKSLLTALDIAALVMLIICAVYYWTIAGYILLALAAVQYIVQTVFFLVAFPVIIVGLGMTVVEAIFIVGAIAALFCAAYTFADLK